MNDPQAHKNVAIDLFPVSLARIVEIVLITFDHSIILRILSEISMRKKENFLKTKTFSTLIMDS